MKGHNQLYSIKGKEGHDKLFDGTDDTGQTEYTEYIVEN